MPIRETARAMDCSVTATQRHLARARGIMAQRLGGAAETAPPSVLTCSMALDVPALFREARCRRSARRRRLRAGALLLVVLAIIALVVWWAWGR